MRDVEARLRNLEQALRLDPYQPRLLLDSALTSWALLLGESAQRTFKVLLAFNPGCQSVRQLLQLVADGKSAQLSAGIFLIGWPVEDALRALEVVKATRDFVEQRGLTPEDSVTVIIRRPDITHSTATFELPGVVIIEVGNLRNLMGSVAHELAHAYLRSNCRFLDEGWAWYVQHQLFPSESYPEKFADMLRWSKKREDRRDLRALLSLPKSTGPLFEPFVRNDTELKSWYCQAVELVHALITRYGWASFFGFMNSLKDAPAADTSSRIAKHFGQSIDLIQAAIAGALPVQVTEQSDILVAAWSSLRLARHGRDASLLDHHMGVLRVWCRANPGDDEARRLLAQFLISDFMLTLGGGKRPDAICIYEAAALAIELKHAGRDDRAELISGLHAQCQILSASSAIERAKWSVAARRHLERAWLLAPNDPEIILALARQELNTPQTHGGDHARGFGLLSMAEKFEGYSQEASASRDYHAAHRRMNAP